MSKQTQKKKIKWVTDDEDVEVAQNQNPVQKIELPVVA
jgi:hypothetical protein